MNFYLCRYFCSPFCFNNVLINNKNNSKKINTKMNNGCKLTKSPHKPKVSTKQHPQSQPQPQSQLQSQLQSQSQPQLQLQSQSQPQPQQKFVPVSPISARILPSTPIITFRGMILSPLRSRLYDIPPNHECRKTTNAYCLLNKDFHGA